MDVDAEDALRFVSDKIFEKTQQRLPEIFVEIFRGSWNRKGYSDISLNVYRSEAHIKNEGLKLWDLLAEVFGEPVKKNTFKSVVLAHLDAEKKYSSSPISPVNPDIYVDLEDAPDEIDLHGREERISTLRQLILDDGYRLIFLLGIGGIGKTALSVALVRQIQSNFDYVIWLSIRESPPLNRILTDLIKVLSSQQELDIPTSTNNQIRSIIQYLNRFRCLIILDNAESIMDNGIHHDRYLPEHEDYGALFDKVATSKHQSCLIVTSRNKPASIAKLQGKSKPVECLFLEGLTTTAAQSILQDNELEGSANEAMQIADIYSGHPLALNLVANCIQELFGGNMANFLSESNPIFEDISQMLDEQFDRLSDSEKSILFWLAIDREPVLLEELVGDMLPPLSQSIVQNDLHSLIRLSLVQRKDKGFTLENVIMEYVIDRLIRTVDLELQTGELLFFNHYALLKATAKDHVREAQIRFILKPISSHFTNLDTQLANTLATIRNSPDLAGGYATGNLINLLCCLNIDLSQYDFSELTIRQAYLQGAIARNVNFAGAKLSKTFFTQDFGIVFSIAYSADGKYMASGHGDGVISLWDVATGQEILNCAGHTGRVYSLAFNATSDLLASSSDDRSVRLWKVSNGDCLKNLLGHSASVGTVAFHPSGEILASGSEDNSIRIWDISSGACLKILEGHTNHIWSVAFSPAGEILASGSFDSSAKIWDTRNWACIKTFVGHSGGITSVAFSPSDPILATGSHDKSVRLWSIEQGACLNILSAHQDRVWSVAFNPTGDLLASGSYDNTVRLWDVNTGTCINKLTDHTNWVRSVAFHPTKGLLASGSYDTTIRIWNIENGKCLYTFQGYQVSVCSLAIQPQGHTLASGSDDRTIRLWDLSTKTLRNTLWGHGGWIYAIAFAPSGELLASGSADKTAKLWNIRSGACLNTLQGHDGWIYSVAFNPAGDLLASGSADKTLRLWNTDNGACLSILQGHTGTVGAVAFSPSGKLLVSGSQDRSIRVWDVRSGVCLKTLQGHTDQIWSIAISPDGNTIASCSFDKTIRLWEIDSGKCLQILTGHLNCLLTVAFSPTGQMLVSGGYDAIVKLWDLQTGECISTLEGHHNWIRSVLFTPDGQTIVSGSQDQTIKLWQTETGECMETMRAPRPYEQMNITGISGLTTAETETLKLLGAIDN
jgi:WD40 repeat protein